MAADPRLGYLVRADLRRGLSMVVWRGRHVAEPTELTDREAAADGREVLLVGRALQAVLQPVKLNYRGRAAQPGEPPSASSVHVDQPDTRA